MRGLTAILSATLLLAFASGVRPVSAAEGGRAKKAAPAEATPAPTGMLRAEKLRVGELHVGPLGTRELRVLLAENGPGATQPTAGKAVKKAKEASCEVVEFHATKTGTKAVDDKLSKWKAELDQPPLSAFDTFKVTGSKSLTIAPGSTGGVKITANLGLLFKGTVTENDKDRLQLEVTIDNAAGKRMYRSTTTQDSGASQILSAGKSGDANVFFVVTCSAQ